MSKVYNTFVKSNLNLHIWTIIVQEFDFYLHRDLITISNFRTSLFEDETHNTRPESPLGPSPGTPSSTISCLTSSTFSRDAIRIQGKRFPSLVKALKAVKPHINHNISRTLFYQTNISWRHLFVS